MTGHGRGRDGDDLPPLGDGPQEIGQVVGEEPRSMRACGQTAAAADARVRVEIHVGAAAVVADLHRTDCNASMAVDALVFIDVDDLRQRFGRLHHVRTLPSTTGHLAPLAGDSIPNPWLHTALSE